MGTKSKKKAKNRLDSYYRLAKDQGYRARSAFKLIQLNRKYDFLAKAKVLVDLCAAPGGWCQVAAKYMPIGSKIIGVDLVPIATIRGVKTFVGDITDDKTRKTITTWLKKEPVDCVIHDGAPNVGGVWSRDLFEQNALVLSAAKIATQLLKPGGWFVTKVFRSQDFHKLMWVMKQLFDKVEATKPLASRMESAEIFVVCAGFKAPKHMDPKMFSAQAVFADVGPEKIMNSAGALVIPKSNVPQGYDEFATIVHRTGTLSEFLNCSDPKDFLKSRHEICFPEEDRHFLKSQYSKKELVYLCQDLAQVGDADRKRLLRWREQLLRQQAQLRQQDEGSENGSDDAEGNVSDLDGDGKEDEEHLDDATRLGLELLEVRKRQAKELKKKQKKLVDRKLKQVKGLINYDPTLSAQHLTETDGFGRGDDVADDAEVSSQQEGDWSIANVGVVDEDRLAALMDKHWVEPPTRMESNLAPIVTVNLEDENDYDLGADEEDDGGLPPMEAGEDAVDEEMEEGEVDVDAYGNYVKGTAKATRVKFFEEGLLNDDDAGAEDDDDDDDEDGDDEKTSRKGKVDKKKSKEPQDGTADDAKMAKWKKHHNAVDKILNRTFPKPRDPRRKKNAEEDVVPMSASGTLVLPSEAGDRGNRKRMRFQDEDEEVSSDVSSLSADESEEDMHVDEGRVDSRRKKAIVQDTSKLTTAELVRLQRKQTRADNKELRKKKKSANNKEKKDDTLFEEIPIAMTDPNVRARTLAIATKMLSKKHRREMLEASVNKFMNNDDDDLPDWFIKDEQRNCKVQLPVTAAEIEAERRRFIELNSRPGKKVMEAMGRKRRKAQRMLRGMIEKGKSDPRARNKAASTSVRKLMRSKSVKGDGSEQKKKKPLDRKSMGEKKRQRQAAKRRK
jgi:AdoMet-dependent rRNA methyltransferase SPB1